VPRGFGFVHHSIAILYHEVPNLSITIRNFFIAVHQAAQVLRRRERTAHARKAAATRERTQQATRQDMQRCSFS
jgi:hypothetical protein